MSYDGFKMCIACDTVLEDNEKDYCDTDQERMDEENEIEYPDIPLNNHGESALQYSWFTIDGLGFSLHVFSWRVSLFAIDAHDAIICYALNGEAGEIREFLEIDITLLEYGVNPSDTY